MATGIIKNERPINEALLNLRIRSTSPCSEDKITDLLAAVIYILIEHSRSNLNVRNT
jgi:hypothetical protein